MDKHPFLRLALVAALAAAAAPASVLAQAPAATGAAAVQTSPEELEKLVGRIALYPDDLVSVILPASTFPLQIVQADRFLEARKANPKAPLDERWDDSVKTLVNYPEVVKSMSSDLDWTSDLGEAVVADSAAVLEAVQTFRRRAQSTGNLKSDSRQVVVVEKEVITIAPADPQVIYVPQYNPSTVVVAGSPYWGYYPAPYPSYYYPYAPGAALATGLIWGAAIGAAWNGGRYVSHYGGGGNTININRGNNNINTGNIGSGNRGGGNTATQWKSNKQPGQVSAGTGRTARTGDAARTSGAGAGGGARASQGGGGNFQGGGGGAFQGSSGSGRQAQMDSSRGAGSRQSAGASAVPRQSAAGGGGARQSSGGGGARMSGGGGGARGGGGRGGGGGRR